MREGVRALAAIGAVGLGILLWEPCLADTGTAKWGGYLKAYSLVAFPVLSGDPGFQLLSPMRLNGSYSPSEQLKAELGYELQGVIQSSSVVQISSAGSALPLAGGIRYRLADLESIAAQTAGDRVFSLYQNLDRLAVYWNLPGADIAVGRQAIAFGSARAIQATDVLLPYTFQQVSTEYRIGVDALRAQIPLSRMGELDLGWVLGNGARASESAAFMRLRGSIAETDVVATGMLFSGAKMLGLGVQRAIWMLGLSADMAYVWTEGAATAAGEYFRLSAALDYAFDSGWMVSLEYHFNGAGAANPAEYVSRQSVFAYQKGGVFLFGRQYLIPGVAYPISALLNAHAQAMINALDGSLYFSTGLEYSASEQVYLDLGVSLALGARPVAGSGTLIPASEFGTYPSQAYAAVRYYY